MGVTERVCAILEPLEAGDLEKALQPGNFTRLLKIKGYKYKIYTWGSDSHVSNQLYKVDITVSQ